MIHFVVRQKLTQHCKAVILQFKEKTKTSNSNKQKDRYERPIHRNHKTLLIEMKDRQYGQQRGFF